MRTPLGHSYSIVSRSHSRSVRFGCNNIRFLCPSSMWNAHITRYCTGQCFLINQQLQRLPFARSWRRLDMNLFHSRLISSVLCQPTSWPTDVDAAASLYDDVITGILGDILPVRFTQTRGSMPTVVLPSASPAVLSRVSWQLIVVQLLRRRPPLLRRLDNYSTTSDVLIANYVIGSVLRFGWISSRQRPVHATWSIVD